MRNRGERVCPVERAGSLDSKIRRWVQNPRKILSPYLEEGMTALDVGCGPGFFAVDMAQMVGPGGRAGGFRIVVLHGSRSSRHKSAV